MTSEQRRALKQGLSGCTPFERRQIEAGLFHVIELAADANLEVDVLHELYEVARGFVGDRVGPRPRVRYRRFADHE